MDVNHTSLVLFGSADHESAEKNFAHLIRLHEVIIFVTSVPDCPIPWDVFEKVSELNNYEKLVLLNMMTEWRRKAFMKLFANCVTECLN